ncbi:MAG TPA: MauE/DoxX family redox-associated membrane protein [Pirellulales bacterium]|nr:MauE/DoxX family redox-associated membrane protein [Pirellulales bacterium]
MRWLGQIASATALTCRSDRVASARDCERSLEVYLRIAARAAWRAVAALLLVAAGLKLAQLSLSTRGFARPPGDVLTDLAAVGAETLTALWMLSRIRPGWSKIAAILLFSIFLCVSITRGLAGAESCGCFGALRVDPWLMAGVDAAVLALLFSVSAPAAARRASVATILAYLGSSLAAAASLHVVISRSSEDGVLALAGGEIVVLTPEAWLGKSFPLLAFLPDAEELSAGPWRAILYHSDCPKCRALIAQYAERLEPNSTANQSRLRGRVALIEMPPFSAPRGPVDGAPFVHLRLRDSERWVVETPTELDLMDGIVVDVNPASGASNVPIGGAVLRPRADEPDSRYRQLVAVR